MVSAGIAGTGVSPPPEDIASVSNPVSSGKAPRKLVRLNQEIKSPMLSYAWEVHFIGAISALYLVGNINYRIKSISLPPWGFSEMRIPIGRWSMSVPGHHHYGDSLEMEFIEDSELNTFTFLSAWTRLVGIRETTSMHKLSIPILDHGLPVYKSLILVCMFSPGRKLPVRNIVYFGVYPLTITNPRLDTSDASPMIYNVTFAYDFYADVSDITKWFLK